MCEPYSSAKLNRLRAYISAMPSIASCTSVSTARSIPSKEKASMGGRLAPVGIAGIAKLRLDEGGRDLSLPV